MWLLDPRIMGRREEKSSVVTGRHNGKVLVEGRNNPEYPLPLRNQNLEHCVKIEYAPPSFYRLTMRKKDGMFLTINETKKVQELRRNTPLIYN